MITKNHYFVYILVNAFGKKSQNMKEKYIEKKKNYNKQYNTLFKLFSIFLFSASAGDSSDDKPSCTLNTWCVIFCCSKAMIAMFMNFLQFPCIAKYNYSQLPVPTPIQSCKSVHLIYSY